MNTFDHNIDNCAGSADQSWTRRCKNYYFELGVTYNLGSSRWRKAPDMDIVDTLHQSELDALNAALEDANVENERLRGLLEKSRLERRRQSMLPTRILQILEMLQQIQ